MGIEWKSQEVNYGLDYSSVSGRFDEFQFDIRYDYEGNPKIKPENCTKYLVIYFKGNRIESTHSKNIDNLKNYADIFMQDLKRKINKYQ